MGIRRSHVAAALLGGLVMATPLLASGQATPMGPAGAAAPAADWAVLTPSVPNVPVVYIATGANFPDALAASAAAGGQRAPVLLVTLTAIPTETASELARLHPDSIVVVGGTGVISDSVAVALAPFTTGTVTRLAGANRYDTAAKVSQANFPTSGVTSGQTVRGDYALAYTATTAADPGADSISWGMTLSDAPTVHVIGVGATPPAECPGSAAMPEAAPGHLCVYQAHTYNLSTVCIASPTVNSCPATADPYGTMVWGIATAPGIAYSYGSWAVTSP